MCILLILFLDEALFRQLNLIVVENKGLNVVRTKNITERLKI